jgi:hypothetical protein
MITTCDLQRDLAKVFRVGNPSSKEVILILGSCRIVAYVNYLDIWNRTIGNNRFLIYALDPFNYNWDSRGNRLNLEEIICKLESNANLLSILASTKIFIHEYFSHFGMFNVDKNLPKHIYQFGMNPAMDITLPNFHDVFILFNDHVKFPPFKEKAAVLKGNLDSNTQEEITEKSRDNIHRFLNVCSKTDFPNMADYFMSHWQKERMFWTFNHVSRNFTLPLWRFLNEQFLNLPETDQFKRDCEGIDICANPFTPICQYDVQHYGIQWKEPAVDFASFNKLK